MSRIRALAFAAAALLVPALTAAAQQESRRDILQRATAAYDDFDLPRAARLARRALDPALGPRDTVWARGVHLLTQLLLESEQAAQAQLWARWATRLEPTLPLDSARFLARVINTLRAARDSGARSAADAAVRETYAWPSATLVSGESRFRLMPSVAPVRVLVRGVGVLSPGAGVVLEPGPYELEVTAEGYLPLHVTREALPGVTTELAFMPLPAAAAADSLRADVRTRVQQGLVTLSVQRFGLTERCAVAAVIGPSGRIATSYDAIRGADSIVIRESPTSAVRVAAWDRNANVAILVASGLSASPIIPAADPMDGQALFGFDRRNCDAAEAGRAIVDASPVGTVTLVAPAPLAPGAVMVDFEGRLVGFYEDGIRVLPRSSLAPYEADADANAAAGVLRSAREVAEAERQRFGVTVLTSRLRGARIRVEPLEPWHWPALDTTGTAPLTFAGPSGRYRVHLLASGTAAQVQEITITPGTRTRHTLSPRVAAAGGVPAQTAQRRRIPKWVWYVAAGVGVAAGIAASGSGGGDPAPSVVISVPNP